MSDFQSYFALALTVLGAAQVVCSLLASVLPAGSPVQAFFARVAFSLQVVAPKGSAPQPDPKPEPAPPTQPQGTEPAKPEVKAEASK